MQPSSKCPQGGRCPPLHSPLPTNLLLLQLVFIATPSVAVHLECWWVSRGIRGLFRPCCTCLVSQIIGDVLQGGFWQGHQVLGLLSPLGALLCAAGVARHRTLLSDRLPGRWTSSSAFQQLEIISVKDGAVTRLAAPWKRKKKRKKTKGVVCSIPVCPCPRDWMWGLVWGRGSLAPCSKKGRGRSHETGLCLDPNSICMVKTC